MKLEKADFSGKPELGWERDEGTTRRLVAVQPADPEVVPPEASQIVDGETIIGRITSSRLSPTLGRSICLAQVDAASAVPGAMLKIVLGDGSRVAARVLEHHAHFDPEGERLRG